MYDNNTASVAFEDTINANLVDLEGCRASLLKALASRRTEMPNPFVRRTNDLRADLRSCFADGAFVTLAAIGWIASAQAEWSLMVEDHWDGDLGALEELGRLVADGGREDLDELVTRVVADGWSGVSEDHERGVGTRTRCRIAVAVDSYAKSKPTWLHRSEATEPHNVLPAAAVSVAAELADAMDGPPPVPPEASPLGIPSRVSAEQPSMGHFSDASDLGVMTSLASVLARPTPPRRLVFGTMVERGVTSLIAAAPGIGKTMLSIQAACAVASGRDWAGFGVPEPGPVVYLNAEDPTDEVARRFRAARLAGLLADEALERISIVRHEDQQRVMEKVAGAARMTHYGEQLLKAVADIRPSLIVVDPMAMIHSLDENSNPEMAELISYFTNLGKSADAGVLVVHHASKDAKVGLGSARGASSIVASVRSVWQLAVPAKEGGSGELSVELTCVKSNYHPTNETRFFRRVQKTLENGDTVGLFEAVGGMAERRIR